MVNRSWGLFSHALELQPRSRTQRYDNIRTELQSYHLSSHYYYQLLNGYTTVAEVSPDTILIIEEIAERVANSNGAALIADYGESTHQKKLSLRVSMYECIHD